MHIYTIQTDHSARNSVLRAQQGIQMTSMNSEALLVITARLQKIGLTVSNMYYSLSSERYEKVSDSLMNVTLLKLQARADKAATTLNKSRADLVEININGEQNFFGGRMAMASETRSMDSNMAAPVAEPGEPQVNITVSARALLSL